MTRRLLTTFASLFITVASTTPIAHGSELLTNGGFDSGNFSGWSLESDTGPVSIKTVMSDGGSHPTTAFIRRELSPYIFMSAAYTQIVNVAPGQYNVTLRGDLKANTLQCCWSNTSGANTFARMELLADGVVVDSRQQNANDTFVTHTISTTVTACTSLGVRIIGQLGDYTSPQHDVVNAEFDSISLDAVYAGPASGCSGTSCTPGLLCDVNTWSTNGNQVDIALKDGSALRLNFLDPAIVEVRFAPTGTFTGNVSRAVSQTSWPIVTPSSTEDAGGVYLETALLRVEVGKAPALITFKDKQGNILLADHSTERIRWASNYTRVSKALPSGERYVGLGEELNNDLIRNGKSFLFHNVANLSGTPGYVSGTDHFLKSIPFYYGIQNGKAYGIFYNDTSRGTVDFGKTSADRVFFQNEGGPVEYYFFAGPSLADVLERYTRLTGRPFMPPKWACGFHQSRWSYTPQSRVAEIINGFRSRNIPLDCIHLDIDYRDEVYVDLGGGTTFYADRQLKFHPSRFPDPSGLMTSGHNQGVRFVANVSPMLSLFDNPLYNDANANSLFLKTSGGSTYQGWFAFVWNCSWLDFSKTATKTWLQSKYSSFLDLGLDGIWNDLNEPDEINAIPDNVMHDHNGNPSNHRINRNHYALMETEMTYNILKDHWSGTKRPWVLSRSGFAGIQRASATWSGDNDSSWAHLQLNIPMGTGLSISGVTMNGHDIGGFFNTPTAEMYARWIQSGVFNPFARVHSTDTSGDQEPWAFGTTVENISRQFINLRYQLMPYLYTLFYESHMTGAPIQRPTFWDFTSDNNTFTQNHDYMFGPFMLVAPVYTQGATTRNVYLPAGVEWTDWWTDQTSNGGGTVNASAPLDKLPLFIREGAIIPMGPVMQYTEQNPISELTLEIYPSSSSSQFTLYEDDGISFQYQSGVYAKTRYTAQRMGDSFILNIGAKEGSYPITSRNCMAKIHHWNTSVISIAIGGSSLTNRGSLGALNSSPDGYYHDTGASLLYAKFPDTGAARALTVNVNTGSHWQAY